MAVISAPRIALEDLVFTNAFAALGERFYESRTPSGLEGARLVAVTHCQHPHRSPPMSFNNGVDPLQAYLAAVARLWSLLLAPLAGFRGTVFKRIRYFLRRAQAPYSVHGIRRTPRAASRSASVPTRRSEMNRHSRTLLLEQTRPPGCITSALTSLSMERRSPAPWPSQYKSCPRNPAFRRV